jgi:hypothetical protein
MIESDETSGAEELYDTEDQACEDCGTTTDVSFDADPYQADINVDYTPVWLCGQCRSNHVDDI